MKGFVVGVLFAAFCICLIYAGIHALSVWYETGQLPMHRKMVFGSEYVSYSADPVSFMWEFSLYVYLIVMGFIGIGSAYQHY
jgi:hypothetical protein